MEKIYTVLFWTVLGLPILFVALIVTIADKVFTLLNGGRDWWQVTPQTFEDD